MHRSARAVLCHFLPFRADLSTFGAFSRKSGARLCAPVFGGFGVDCGVVGLGWMVRLCDRPVVCAMSALRAKGRSAAKISSKMMRETVRRRRNQCY